MPVKPIFSDSGYPLHVVCTEDVQEIADRILGRELSLEELGYVEDRLHLNWAEEVKLLIEWKLK